MAVPLEEYERMVCKFEESERRAKVLEEQNRRLLDKVSRLELDVSRVRLELQSERAERRKDKDAFRMLKDRVNAAGRRTGEGVHGHFRVMSSMSSSGSNGPLYAYSRDQDEGQTEPLSGAASIIPRASEEFSVRSSGALPPEDTEATQRAPRRPSWQTVRRVVSRGCVLP